MKKLSLTCILAVLYIALSSAQFNIGGTFLYSSGKEEHKTDTESTKFSLSISPAVGYSFNDKMESGLMVSFGISETVKYLETVIDNEILLKPASNTTNSLTVSPYFRYSFFRFGKFRIAGQASVYAGYSKLKYKNSFYYQQDDAEQTKQFNYGITILPVLIYDLSNKFSFISYINILRLQFSQTRIDKTSVYSDFSCAFSTENIISSSPSIGCRYKF